MLPQFFFQGRIFLKFRKGGSVDKRGGIEKTNAILGKVDPNPKFGWGKAKTEDQGWRHFIIIMERYPFMLFQGKAIGITSEIRFEGSGNFFQEWDLFIRNRLPQQQP